MAPVSKYSLVPLELKPLKRNPEPEPISPLDIEAYLKARDAPANQYNPGAGMISPTSISNNGIFALFGILAAGLVLSSIWFFFWAKNGGFHFRKGDWEDYKTTVLRRKGPNGTTLSGATKSTKLGDGSVVGSQGSMSEFYAPEKAESNRGGKNKKRSKPVKNSRDDDVRAYRHEKVAKVGGLNREPDGSYHAYTNTAMSEETSSQAPISPAYKSSCSPSTSNTPKPNTPKPNKTTGTRNFSYAPASESHFSVASEDSRRPLRASPSHHHANRHSNNSTPAGYARQPSPSKRYTNAGHHNSRYSSRMSGTGTGSGGYTEPLDFDSRYEASSVGESEQVRNTKAYHHPIPGLSKGPNAAGTGFRRAGMGRRDSLGDSDGETGMS